MRSRPLTPRARWALVVVVALFGGCDNATDPVGEREVTTAAPETADSVVANPGGIILPPEATPTTNPLELPEPVGQPVPEEGQRVFAVPRAMLENARVGTAMKLAAATVYSREGENYVVQIGTGAPYQVHPAYMVIPRPGRFNRGSYIIASHGDELRHAVVKNRLADRVTVRFTDIGRKSPDQRLDPKRIGLLPAGLAPGAYAAHLDEHEYRHVLLVSSSTVAGKERWLVLRYGGETELVSADKLRALPVPRFKPRIGETLLAAWRGTLVRTQVTEIDQPGILTVTRARAGLPLFVGPGMVMPTE